MLKWVHRYTRHSIRYMWRFSIAGIVLVAVILTLFRVMTPWLNTHKTEVEQQLSVLLGETVTIQHMETNWYWFQPILKLNQVLVSDNATPLLQLNQLLVGVDLWQSLLHWQIQPGLMLIDDVQLTLRQTESGWQIDGLRQGEQLSSIAPTSYWPLLRWLMLQQKIKIKHVSGEVYLKDGTLLPIDSLMIKAAHHRGRYRLNGKVRVGKDSQQTEFNVKGDIAYTANSLETAEGELFFSAEHVDFEAWKILLAHLPYQIEGGQGDCQVWVKLVNGRVGSVQSTIKLREFAWLDPQNNKRGLIDYLDVNLAWRPTELGWTLSGDHLFLSTHDKSWPENAFMLTYEAPAQNYRLFIEKMHLDPALLTWLHKDSLAPIIDFNIQGDLKDTQLGFSEGQLNFILSRFSKLSWQGKGDIPSVQNLSGALYWEPTEGRLELDGEKTRLKFARQASLEFQTVNASLDWRQQNGAWRLSLDRLILEHPNLLLSVRGLWDGYSQQTLGTMQLTSEFSSKQAHFWLPYLPEAYLKPKLAAWLKNDIKRIGAVNGHVLLNGSLDAFPFDQSMGDFAVTASLEDVDLKFHADWPEVSNIDAYLTVDKRVLNADITKANLAANVPVKKLNIHVSELGLGQETLLVHGHVDALANQMLQYVQHSPLQKKLRKLSVLSVDNNLDLDLALAVPLNAENDNLSVHGSILFDNNDTTVNLSLAPIVMKRVLGTLFFDEHGVSESFLQASLLEEMVRLQIQTVETPKPSTEIRLFGDFALSVLRQQLKIPLLQFVQGHLPLEGLLTLVDDPKSWDSLEIQSTLQDVAIELPPPFDKKADMVTPMSLKTMFNFDQGIHLQTFWSNRLNSDIWFNGKDKQFSPARGLVCFNCKEAKASTRAGVIFEGKVDDVHWSEWQEIFNQMHVSGAADLNFQLFQSIHLTVNSLMILGQNYQNLEFFVNQSKDVWNMMVKQQNETLANLKYQTVPNLLSGDIKKLTYVKTKEKSSEKRAALNPSQIPNLALSVDSVYWDQKKLGHLTLTGANKKNTWQLTEAKLEAEAYTLSVKGAWFKQDLIDKTDFYALLKLNDLAKLLEIWDVPSVVMARDGTLTVEGGWLGDFRAFALNRVTGQVYIILKDGRITHFDPETEKKLGLGRLLSILSLQTIPRRLKLDFSDLANDGYSFDQFEGQFTLKNGVMSTENSMIDGPVALVNMKGNLDLDKRLYDLDLHVSPHVTASLPVVATIAGGPIAGIATWAASKILNYGVDKVTGYTYTITGPWFEPVVQQVHIYRKKAADSHKTAA